MKNLQKFRIPSLIFAVFLGFLLVTEKTNAQTADYGGFQNADGSYSLDGYVDSGNTLYLTSIDSSIGSNKIFVRNIKMWIDTLGNEPVSSSFDSYNLFECDGNILNDYSIAAFVLLDGRDGSIPYNGTLSDSNGDFSCIHPRIINTNSSAAIGFTINYLLATSTGSGLSSSTPLHVTIDSMDWTKFIIAFGFLIGLITFGIFAYIFKRI